MGAWIEIKIAIEAGYTDIIVAPLVGAWIEIFDGAILFETKEVAPLVGAWIEIMQLLRGQPECASLLSWERGLK